MLIAILILAVLEFMCIICLTIYVCGMNTYMKDMYDKFIEMKSIFNILVFDKYKMTPNEILNIVADVSQKVDKNINNKGENE